MIILEGKKVSLMKRQKKKNEVYELQKNNRNATIFKKY